MPNYITAVDPIQRGNLFANTVLAAAMQTQKLKAAAQQAEADRQSQMARQLLGTASDFGMQAVRGQQQKGLQAAEIAAQQAASDTNWKRSTEIAEINGLVSMNNRADQDYVNILKASKGMMGGMPGAQPDFNPMVAGAIPESPVDVLERGMGPIDPNLTIPAPEYARSQTPYQIAKQYEYADELAKIAASEGLSTKQKLVAQLQVKQKRNAAAIPVGYAQPKPPSPQEMVAQSVVGQYPPGTFFTIEPTAHGPKTVPHLPPAPKSGTDPNTKAAELRIKIADSERKQAEKRESDKDKEFMAFADKYRKENLGASDLEVVNEWKRRQRLLEIAKQGSTGQAPSSVPFSRLPQATAEDLDGAPVATLTQQQPPSAPTQQAQGKPLDGLIQSLRSRGFTDAQIEDYLKRKGLK